MMLIGFTMSSIPMAEDLKHISLCPDFVRNQILLFFNLNYQCAEINR